MTFTDFWDFISWAPRSLEQNKNHKGFISHLFLYLISADTYIAIKCRLQSMLSPVKRWKHLVLPSTMHLTDVDLCILLLLTETGSIPHCSKEEQVFNIYYFRKLTSACEPLHLTWPRPKHPIKYIHKTVANCVCSWNTVFNVYLRRWSSHWFSMEYSNYILPKVLTLSILIIYNIMCFMEHSITYFR